MTAPEPAPLPEETSPPQAELDPPNAEVVEPGIASTGAPTRGVLPKAVIAERLKAVAPAIQACYEQALKTKPDLRGTLLIHFVVAPDGKVAHAESGETDEPLDDAPTINCVLSEIGKLEFPQPRGGRVFVDYPLRLEPAKAEP